MVPAVASRGNGTLPSHGTHFGDLVIKIWQHDQLAEMLARCATTPFPRQLASVEAVVRTARDKLPEMEPRFVAYPGNIFSGSGHFIVFTEPRGASEALALGARDGPV